MISYINLERDSVCAGDDADAPHVFTLDTSGCSSAIEILEAVRTKYLPRIFGGNATWVALSTSGTPIAVIAQQWKFPKLLSEVTELPGDLFLKYYAQEDPKCLFQFLVSSRAV